VRVQEVTPNGENATLEELAVAMEAAPNKRSDVRLAAIRALLMGVPRAQVCRLYHRSDRLIRLWIEMFNRGGIDALASKPRTGRPPKV
jgi:transposase